MQCKGLQSLLESSACHRIKQTILSECQRSLSKPLPQPLCNRNWVCGSWWSGNDWGRTNLEQDGTTVIRLWTKFEPMWTLSFPTDQVLSLAIIRAFWKLLLTWSDQSAWQNNGSACALPVVCWPYHQVKWQKVKYFALPWNSFGNDLKIKQHFDYPLILLCKAVDAFSTATFRTSRALLAPP